MSWFIVGWITVIVFLRICLGLLSVGLRSSSFDLYTLAKHVKTHVFGLAYSRQGTHFRVCITFVGCDTVTVSPNQIIIIIIIDLNTKYSTLLFVIPNS